ncbi:unannotated protein [freshwater metagenome]|uniref:Unannotated protein n=1 Tax=freshwater metagenome TaxID=449393 RepID=A0A6J7G6G1_9ZZZZ
MPPGGAAERLEHHQVPVYLGAVLAGGLLGVAAPGTESALEAAIVPVLGALLYVTFLAVPFTALHAAYADRRFLLAALGLNFLVVPVVAFALSRLAPGGPAVELGVLLVLLTPCIDYVVVFTRMAGGDHHRLLAAAPLLMLVQLALLPVLLWLFLGPGLADVVDPGPFVEAFALLIALPLALARATQSWAERSATGARTKAAADRTPVVLMAATLLVVVASQVPRVRGELGEVVGVVPLFVLFLVVMGVLGRALALRLRLAPPTGRALVFSGATRNSLVVLPLALALDDAYALTAAVVVTQTLVEIVGMVVYVRLVPRLLPDPPNAPRG